MKVLLIFLMLILAGCGRPGAAPEYGLVPDFSLTERSNRTITRQDLTGKVWVADFIFTRCSGVCLTMSSNMRKLQDVLPVEVRLVSFSVDPHNDTPRALSEYAARYGADAERWLFLTGDLEAIQQLSVGGFKLALDASSGTEAEPTTHSSRFALVDREGQIRGYYGMEDAEALDRLIADARKLL